ncbi:MAG: hypothetical protein QM730_02745 [Anaerolineales bacterium]
MNDVMLFTVVIAGAFVLILGVSFLMDQRRKAVNKATAVPTGPVSRVILWISYVILALTILFVIGSFTANAPTFIFLARNFIFLYIIVGIIYRIVRPRGV